MLTKPEIQYLVKKYQYLRATVDISNVSKEEHQMLKRAWLQEYRNFYNV